MNRLVDQAPGVFLYDTDVRGADPERHRRVRSTT